MKVYTKTGDDGRTSLFNGARVGKDDVRVQAYGTLDECNAIVGVAKSTLEAELRSGALSDSSKRSLEEYLPQLTYIQNRFFDLGAYLATPRSDSDEEMLSRTSFPSEATVKLERWIDELQDTLPPLSTFILPGGHPAAAQLHVARTVSRRVERSATGLIESKEITGAAFSFLNRVSDYFFVASRYVNHVLGHEDVFWARETDA